MTFAKRRSCAGCGVHNYCHIRHCQVACLSSFQCDVSALERACAHLYILYSCLSPCARLMRACAGISFNLISVYVFLLVDTHPSSPDLFHFPMSITFITRVVHALVLVSVHYPFCLSFCFTSVELRALPLYKRAVAYLVSAVRISN
jgi:hypothetical protein